MSLTSAVHKRFWSAMGERFGKRWLDEYGEIPTLAWREMLDKYKPADIAAALELMATKGWQHPPTQPQFEPLLREAANDNKPDEQDWCRNYWRAVVIDQFSKDFWLAKLIPSMEDFEQYLLENREILAEVQRVLNHVDELEKRTGQRTDGMHELVCKRSFELALERSEYFQFWMKCRKEGMKIRDCVQGLFEQMTVKKRA